PHSLPSPLPLPCSIPRRAPTAKPRNPQYVGEGRTEIPGDRLGPGHSGRVSRTEGGGGPSRLVSGTQPASAAFRKPRGGCGDTAASAVRSATLAHSTAFDYWLLGQFFSGSP